MPIGWSSGWEPGKVFQVLSAGADPGDPGNSTYKLLFILFYAHEVLAWCPRVSEEGVASPGTGVTDRSAPLCGFWEPNPGYEPSFQRGVPLPPIFESRTTNKLVSLLDNSAWKIKFTRKKTRFGFFFSLINGHCLHGLRFSLL